MPVIPSRNGSARSHDPCVFDQEGCASWHADMSSSDSAHFDVSQSDAESVAEVDGHKDLLEQPACASLRDTRLRMQPMHM